LIFLFFGGIIKLKFNVANMMYFSGILKSDVTDASEKVVGRLKDILIKSQDGEYAPLEFLVIAGKGGGLFYIPYGETEHISKSGVVLRRVWDKLERVTERPTGCLSLVDDIYDQQIMDINGARVVRANDLRFAVVDDKMRVVGIDVSVRGLFRRLGLLWLDVFHLLKTNLIDWRDASPVRGTLKIGALASNFHRLHPADMADIIEDLHLKRGSKLVGYLDPRSAAKVLEEMDEETQKKFLKSFDPGRIRQILDNMSTDEVVDLIQSFSKSDAAVYLSFLGDERHQAVKKLLAHDDDTAGGLMTVDYIPVSLDLTVAQAMEEVRKFSARFRSILYIYGINTEGVFRGAISLRRLLLAKPEQKLREVIKKQKRLPTLSPDDNLNYICDMMTRYNLFSVAVLDKDHKMLGVVTIDDVMRTMRPRA